MDMSFMQDITPQLLRATKNTITLAVGSLIVSLFIAIIISLAIYYKVPILTQILKIYVSFFSWNTRIGTTLFNLFWIRECRN